MLDSASNASILLLSWSVISCQFRGARNCAELYFSTKRTELLVEIISSRLRYGQLNFRKRVTYDKGQLLEFYLWKKKFEARPTDIAVNSSDPTPVSGIYRTLVRIKSIINAFALILILRKREWPWDKILDEVLMGFISAVGSLGEASHRLGNTSALENSQAPGNCPPNPVEIGKWQLFQVIAL